MSIKHFEDLSPSKVKEFLLHSAQFKATEKIDGSQLFIGIDELGFYTSRDLVKKFYSEKDYDSTEFSNTYRRFAHLVIEQNLENLKAAGFVQGAVVEVEVLFGDLPNVVEYSDINSIVFLRVIEGSVNFDQIMQEQLARTLSVTLTIPTVNDRLETIFEEKTLNAQILTVPEWDKVVGVVLHQQLFRYTKFLSTVESESKQTYSDILELNLSHTKKYSLDKNRMRDIKARIQRENACILHSIKERLLDEFVRGKSSKLGASWIEGIVLTNGSITFKLVDKDVFRTAQQFIWKVRASLEVLDPESLQPAFDKYIKERETYLLDVKPISKVFSYSEAVHKRTLEAFVTRLKKNENR